ncbi:lipoprotein signal peptidase [Neisseria shayeganii]|uniref:lipoprotein signal peptidase n=1 Tax=Neisseria shayeganii TaxID=607712 RepID=UPI001FD07562|nr:lipoprotein signal peptidase [Neisseria shayeganii]
MPRPLQNPHLRRISALCAARSLAYLSDMSALTALLRLELHPHLKVLQRSHAAHKLRHPLYTGDTNKETGYLKTFR